MLPLKIRQQVLFFLFHLNAQADSSLIIIKFYLYCPWLICSRVGGLQCSALLFLSKSAPPLLFLPLCQTPARTQVFSCVSIFVGTLLPLAGRKSAAGRKSDQQRPCTALPSSTAIMLHETQHLPGIGDLHAGAHTWVRINNLSAGSSLGVARAKLCRENEQLWGERPRRGEPEDKSLPSRDYRCHKNSTTRKNKWTAAVPGHYRGFTPALYLLVVVLRCYSIKENN